MNAVQLKSPLTGEAMGAQELANTLAHYYRGELSHTISWRDRMDRTTNWAIAATAAMLSVSMTNYDVHHSLMLFSMPVIFLLMVIESRRYRFFDVYRRRLRIFERCYYANLFSPGADNDPACCLKELGESLRRPQFSLTMGQAMARRLRRNYCWIFTILLAGWLLKVVGAVDWRNLIASPQKIHRLAAIGWTPGWMVMAVVLTFYTLLLVLMLRYGDVEEERVFGEVYV